MADNILFEDYTSDSEIDQETTLMDCKTNEEMDQDGEVLEEERAVRADTNISKRYEEALSMLDICMESESQNWTAPITTLQGRPDEIAQHQAIEIQILKRRVAEMKDQINTMSAVETQLVTRDDFNNRYIRKLNSEVLENKIALGRLNRYVQALQKKEKLRDRILELEYNRMSGLLDTIEQLGEYANKMEAENASLELTNGQLQKQLSSAKKEFTRFRERAKCEKESMASSAEEALDQLGVEKDKEWREKLVDVSKQRHAEAEYIENLKETNTKLEEQVTTLVHELDKLTRLKDKFKNRLSKILAKTPWYERVTWNNN